MTRSWLMCVCDMTHSMHAHYCDEHVRFVLCATWCIRNLFVTHVYMWHDSFVTHLCMWDDSFGTRSLLRRARLWIVCLPDMTHSWRIYTCDTTHATNARCCDEHVRLVIYVTWRIHNCNEHVRFVVCVTWCIHNLFVTHVCTCMWHRLFEARLLLRRVWHATWRSSDLFVTDLRMWYDSFMTHVYVTRLIRSTLVKVTSTLVLRDVRRDALVTCSWQICVCDIAHSWRIYTCNMTHSTHARVPHCGCISMRKRHITNMLWVVNIKKYVTNMLWVVVNKKKYVTNMLWVVNKKKYVTNMLWVVNKKKYVTNMLWVLNKKNNVTNMLWVVSIGVA